MARPFPRLRARRPCPARPRLRLVVYRGSGAAIGDDQVSRDTEQEADAEHVEPELGVTLPPGAGPDLTDDIEDRPSGEREEAQRERVTRDLVADHRADEGGSAGDQ